MELRHVDGKHLYDLLAAGSRELIQQQRFLNKINVFPVPDKDTGNNMAATLTYILDTVQPEKDLGETLQAVADASLSGARGNSGMILAQFFNGAAREIRRYQELTVENVGDMLTGSVPYAYAAMAQPVEGTMLTVMKAWAEAFRESGKGQHDIRTVFQQSVEQAQRALAETREKMEVLRKAGVVDSGAQGFVCLLEGIAGMMHSGFQQMTMTAPRLEPLATVAADGGQDEGPNYRYCTEGLLVGERLDPAVLKSLLGHWGDSVISVGTSERCRFHLHTDHPAQVLAELSQLGTPVQQKVDDMKRQMEMLTPRQPSIALVTDSIADLPLDMQDQYQIHRVPLQLAVDGADYIDQITITTPHLFQRLPEVLEYPASSQPPVKRIREVLDALAQHYDSILVLTVSSQNSGTWQAFLHVAEQLSTEGNDIRVIDTKKNSGAEGLLVLKAAESIADGKSLEEVVELVERWIPRTHIFVSVATFDSMVRGGRVSPMKGKLAKWLNLKPIVSLDEEGKGIAFAKAFSRGANTRKIMEIVQRLHEQAPVERYCVVHAEAREKANEYASLLEQKIGFPPAYITDISPVVALNAGKGAVAVALVQSSKSD